MPPKAAGRHGRQAPAPQNVNITILWGRGARCYIWGPPRSISRQKCVSLSPNLSNNSLPSMRPPGTRPTSAMRRTILKLSRSPGGRLYRRGPRRRYGRRRGTSGLKGITTFQKDVKQSYRYRRAPNRLRRKWRRSSRSWTNNQLKNATSRKYHYSGTARWQTTAGRQGWFGFLNYGMKGTGGYDGTGDVSDVWTRINLQERPQNTLTDGGEQARRMYFDRCNATCTLTNAGTTAVHFELFECYARDDMPLSMITGGTATLETYFDEVAAPFHQADLDDNGPGAPNSFNQTSEVLNPDSSFLGMTPFDFRYFCQKWKITKVTRMQCSPGNTISFDCSLKRQVRLSWDDAQPLFSKKGVTKMYLVRQWGRTVSTPAVGTSASDVVFNIEKDYTVKILDNKLPELNWLGYTNTTP